MRSLTFIFYGLLAASIGLAPLITAANESPALQLTLDKSPAEDLRLAPAPEGEKVKPDIWYVPTPQRLVDLMLLMAQVNKDDLLYDLGSGDGRLVITAAKIYGARAIGIEIDPAYIAEARKNAVTAGVQDRVEFWQQDLFKSNFKDATVITLYLLDELNRRLRPQIFAEVRPGARIVSHAFHMGEWEPDAEKTLKIEGKSYDAYFWVVPANMSGRWKVIGNPGIKGLPETIVVDQIFQKFALRAGDDGEVIGEGRVTGTEFYLTIDKPADGKPMTFTGTIDGGHIEASAPGKTVRWKAERESGSEKPLDPGR